MDGCVSLSRRLGCSRYSELHDHMNAKSFTVAFSGHSHVYSCSAPRFLVQTVVFMVRKESLIFPSPLTCPSFNIMATPSVYSDDGDYTPTPITRRSEFDNNEHLRLSPPEHHLDMQQLIGMITELTAKVALQDETILDLKAREAAREDKLLMLQEITQSQRTTVSLQQMSIENVQALLRSTRDDTRREMATKAEVQTLVTQNHERLNELEQNIVQAGKATTNVREQLELAVERAEAISIERFDSLDDKLITLAEKHLSTAEELEGVIKSHTTFVSQQQLENARAQELSQKIKDIESAVSSLKQENGLRKEENSCLKEVTRVLQDDTEDLRAETVVLGTETTGFKQDSGSWSFEMELMKENNESVKAETVALREDPRILKEAMRVIENETALVKNDTATRTPSMPVPTNSHGPPTYTAQSVHAATAAHEARGGYVGPGSSHSFVPPGTPNSNHAPSRSQRGALRGGTVNAHPTRPAGIPSPVEYTPPHLRSGNGRGGYISPARGNHNGPAGW